MFKCLTIYKSDRHLLDTSFTTTILSNVFHRTNYKLWRARTSLRLTAIRVIYVAQGKPVGPLNL